MGRLFSASCYKALLCEAINSSVGRIPGVKPVVSLATESGIGDSPGNLNHSAGSTPNMQGPVSVYSRWPSLPSD